MADKVDKQVAVLRSLIVALQGVVDSLESSGVEMSPEVASKIKLFRETARCLYCTKSLKGEPTTRGCHQTCYNLLNQRINRGKITRADAIGKGWMNPVAEKPGRKTSRPDPMLDELFIAPAVDEAVGEAVAAAAEQKVDSTNAKRRAPRRAIK